jgi:2-(1,2-epoxy-1,2-dihydrophenyl)acetyl-CoA isomerase
MSRGHCCEATLPSDLPTAVPAVDPGIRRSAHDAVVTITIDRPHLRNSLDRASVLALVEAFEASTAARCVVLRATGSSFCSGGDLPHLERLAGRPHEIRGSIEGFFQRLIRTIRAHPAPVIARVQGPAVGAGADLALACDLRVASTDAWLREPWIELGLISALGAPINLGTAGGPGFALDVLLSGRRVAAEEALARGVFQRAVAPDALDAELDALVTRVAAMDPEGVRAMKQLVNLTFGDDVDRALRAGLDHQERLMRSPDFVVRVRAILAGISRRTRT